MFKSIALWLGIIFVFALVGAGFYFDEIPVTFSEETVNKMVQPNFPIQESKMFVDLTIHDVDIEFLETGQARIKTNLTAESSGLKGDGDAVLLSSLRYDKGSFYLQYFQVESLDFEDSGDIKAKDVASQGNSLFGKLKDKASEMLPNSNVSKYIDEKKDSVVEGVLTFAEAKLAEIPIYTIDTSSFKMKMAAESLKGVVIADGEVSVIISPRFLMTKLVLWTFAFALSLLFVIAAMRQPDAFIGLLLFSALTP